MTESFCTEDYCIIPGEPVLETRELGVSYLNSHAFESVNLKVPMCSVQAIIGPSGCGKSSFLMCLNRMTDYIEDCQVVGDVKVEGHSIFQQNFDVAKLRSYMGMIFQKPNPFPMSIHKNIDLPLKYHGYSKPEREETIEKVLQEVGLWQEVKDRLRANALELSGGQQQRLCIARAISLRPKILLLDEPCSALDPIASGVVEELIVDLKAKYTLVVVTHNLGQARRISDQTALFWVKNQRGYLAEAGPTKELFSSPKTQICAGYLEGAVG